MTELPQMVALHKHWVTADMVLYHLRHSIGEEIIAQPLQPPKTVEEYAIQHSISHTLSVYYSLLYVVIEGYRELKCQDEKIDKLLGYKDAVDALRRFRNAVFHYQQEPFPQKLSQFLRLTKSEAWLRELNEALKDFFFREMNMEEFGREFQRSTDVNKLYVAMGIISVR